MTESTTNHNHRLMYSLIFPAAFADDLASLGIEYLTIDSRPDIIECIESIDHPLIAFLRGNANHSYRIS